MARSAQAAADSRDALPNAVGGRGLGLRPRVPAAARSAHFLRVGVPPNCPLRGQNFQICAFSLGGLVDVIAGALIGLLGGLIAALIVARQQRDSTRALIAAEFDKLTHQQALQSKSHVRSRKEDWLLQSVPALLAASDPELHAEFNYTEVVTLIHKLQVILVPTNALEGAVNQAANDIGVVVQAAKSGQRNISSLLSAQDALVRATRALLDSP